MKGLLTAIFIILIVFLFVLIFPKQQKNSHDVQKKVMTTTPTPVSINSIKIEYSGHSYELIYEKVTDKTVSLIPNFTEKQTASSIAETNSCKIASSGGFYTKQDTPLGLYKKDGKQISNAITASNLLTGYFFETEGGIIGISNEPPSDAPNIIQAGPFFETGREFPTKQDEYARRIVFIEDTSGAIYIGTIIENENTYSGPMLRELPSVLFSIRSPFKVNRVLNLDGGNASYFMTKNGYTLSEITAVGSLLCFK